MADEVDGIFVLRVSAAAFERQGGDLDEIERGALFIPWPRPPRVGSHVFVDLAFGDEDPERHEASVVWSRPARTGIVAGFRAQLVAPGQELLDRLKALVDTARRRLAARDLVPGRPAAGTPARPDDRSAIREKISAQPRYANDSEDYSPLSVSSRPRSFLLSPREVTVSPSAPPPVPPRPPPPEQTIRPRSIELPPDDDFGEALFTGRDDLMPLTFTGDRADLDDAPYQASTARPSSLAANPTAPPAPDLHAADPSDFSDLAFDEPAEPPPPPPRPPPPPPKPPPPQRVPAADPRVRRPTPEPLRAAHDPSDFSDLAAEFGAQPPPPPRPPPPRPPPAPVADPSDFSDLAEEFGAARPRAPAPAPRSAPPPARPIPPAPEPPRPAPPPPRAAPPRPPDPAPRGNSPVPVRVGFASGRSFLMHFERFLSNSEVYITHVAALAPGTTFPIIVDVPDGGAPLQGYAMCVRLAAPPDVPRPGWIARLIDPDGRMIERLLEASFGVREAEA